MPVYFQILPLKFTMAKKIMKKRPDGFVAKTVIIVTNVTCREKNRMTVLISQFSDNLFSMLPANLVCCYSGPANPLTLFGFGE